ncbi:MAG: cytochrome b [Sphingopyxis sp.]|nr:cytochrome b [Sphingopyxis sp.]
MTVTVERYSRVSRWLHWGMAILIIGNLAGGLLHDVNAALIMPIHKATGIGILALTMLRIVWRMAKPAPAWPTDMKMWEGALASFTHGLLYAFMLLVPLSGWVMSSASEYPISFFGLFDVPKFAIVRESTLWNVAHEGHELMGFALIALLVLHIGAALRHHFVLKDGILHRMWG